MPDLHHYQGREQAFVKHALIEKYLTRFAIKISSKWDEIVLIDAFAGPWGAKSEDYQDTSFCIALKCLEEGTRVAQERFGRKTLVRAVLIEKNPNAFRELKKFGESKSRPGFEIISLEGAFEDQHEELRRLVERGASKRAFTFALIDPKGWSGLSMQKIAPLVRGRSSEVLVNVMTSFIGRFVDVENCRDSYESFFGRKGVAEAIAATPMSEREDAVVREYCRSLRSICGFKHVSSCVVLEPGKKGVKYFMVFGTNDPMGIKVFKEAEAHAASLQDEIQERKTLGNQLALFSTTETGRVSDSLRERYRKRAFRRVEELFIDQISASYAEVFCEAMAMPLITESELIEYLRKHMRLEIRLDGQRRKRPNIENLNDLVIRKGA
jgi:three-Cys-motif partner protein